ncbi:MAG: hypothetical protein JO010_08590 [Alphaproteobacteria bacterium]|nr:hypothetical protein [Alphaproteobacteria bacterium]
MSSSRWQQVLHVLGVATFFVCLGWTIPYMITMPFLRLQQAFTMMWTGMPILLGRDLTMMVPCALAVYFVLYGKSVRAFWSRWPWSGPLILVCFIAALGTTLMAHLAHVATANKLERWSVVLAVFGAFVLWRALITALAWMRPLENFVIHDPRHRMQ